MKSTFRSAKAGGPEFVSKIILDVSYDLFKVVSNLETKNYSRGLDILDLLSLANMPDVISADI